MGQYERRNFADDGVLEFHYEKFYAHKKRIELALEKKQYDMYAMKGLLRAAKLIASHPDDRNGNPKVLSTVELVDTYKKNSYKYP